MGVGQKGLSTGAIVGIVVAVVVVVVAVAVSAVILLKLGEGGATPTTTIMTPTTTTPTTTTTTPTTTTPTTTTTTTAPATTTTPTTTATPSGGIGRVVSLTAEAVHEATYGGTMLKIVVEKEESYAPEYQELFRFVLQGPRGLIYDGENVYDWVENCWSYYHEPTYLFEWVGNVGTFHIPMAGYQRNADGGTYNLSIYDCWGNLVYENQYTFSGPKLEVLCEPTVYFSDATMVSYEPTLYERGIAGVTMNIANTGDLPAYVHATRISVPGYGTTANSTFYLGELVTYVVSGVTYFEGQGPEYGAVLIMPGENVIFSPAPFGSDPNFHTLPTASAQFLNISLLEEKFAGSMGSMFTTGEFTRILLSYDMGIFVPPE